MATVTEQLDAIKEYLVDRLQRRFGRVKGVPGAGEQQREFAKRAGFSEPWLTQVLNGGERGQLGDSWAKIADALGLELEFLLTEAMEWKSKQGKLSAIPIEQRVEDTANALRFTAGREATKVARGELARTLRLAERDGREISNEELLRMLDGLAATPDKVLLERSEHGNTVDQMTQPRRRRGHSPDSRSQKAKRAR